MPITNIQELYKIAVVVYYNSFKQDFIEFYASNSNWLEWSSQGDTWSQVKVVRPLTLDFVRKSPEKYHNFLLKLSQIRPNVVHADMYVQFTRSILLHAYDKVGLYDALAKSLEAVTYTLWTEQESYEAALFLSDYIEWQKAAFWDNTAYLEPPEAAPPVNIREYMLATPFTFVLFDQVALIQNSSWTSFSAGRQYMANATGRPIVGSKNLDIIRCVRDVLSRRTQRANIFDKEEI